jgi:ubiquinone/menaquinone biosynthesis C-methylase UbiE
MPVHDVAQRGFDAGASAYERARPSYPPDAVAWLVEHCGIVPDARVCDLAAGTGKFTRLIEPIGTQLIAVEPVEGMRRLLHESFGGLPVVAATAEALPFEAASIDAVTVAQAFHWFDADRAFAELGRVLRVGGRVGIIWNARDRSVDWVDALWSIMDRVEKQAPWRDHDDRSAVALGARTGFGPIHQAEFWHEQQLTPDDVVDRFASVSHVAVLGDSERSVVLDEIRSVLANHPTTAGREELAIPYRVDAYWCERLA